jgi:cellulose synthase operon protein C
MRRYAKLLMATALISTLGLVSACASPEEKAERAHSRYQEFMAERDFVRAHVEIRNAIREREDFAPYWADLAKAELGMQKYENGYLAYTRALELDPENVEYIRALADLSFAGGDLEGATKFNDRLLAKDPNSIFARALKASIAFQNKDLATARSELDFVIGKEPTNSTAIVLQARLLQAEGKPTEAISYLRGLIARSPNDPMLLQTLLTIQKEQNDRDGQSQTYERLIQILPAEKGLSLTYASSLIDWGRTVDAERVLNQLVTKNPKDIDLKLRVGAIWRDRVSPAVALEKLRQFLAQDNDPRLRLEVANFLAASGQLEAAQRELQPLTEGKEPTTETLDAFGTQAALAWQRGDRAQAESVVARILAVEEGNVAALRLQTQMFVQANRLDDALASARVILRNDPNSVPGMMLLGSVHERRNEVDLAKQSYQRALAAQPNDPAVLEQLTNFLLRNNEAKAADEAVRNFLLNNPNSPAGWSQLANIKLQSGDLAGANEVLSRMRASEGGQAIAGPLSDAIQRARQNSTKTSISVKDAVEQTIAGKLDAGAQALAWVNAGQGLKAREYLLEVNKRQPSNVPALKALARIAGSERDYGRARDLLESAIKSAPNDAEAYAMLAWAFSGMDDNAAALAAVDRGLKAKPGDTSLMFTRSNVAEAAGDYAMAIAALREMLKIQPDSQVAKNNLAALLTDHARTPAERAEALTWAQQLKGSANVPAISDTIGWAYVRNGQAATGLPFLRQAVAAAPNNAVLQYHLGVALKATGDAAGGAQALRTALAAAQPGSPWISEARRLIAN